MQSHEQTPSETPKEPNRREVFESACRAAMGVGLVTGYGTACLMAGMYLYPAKSREVRWTFVCTLDRLAKGDSLDFTTPTGEKVAVARMGAGTTAGDFVALSSTCPHLGCQVHWQSVPRQFFCPCHNGAFDAAGKAIQGPPADAGTDLPRYPLEVRGQMLFIEVPVVGLSSHVAVEGGRSCPARDGTGEGTA